MLTLLMLLVACDRPTDEYPVRLHGAGTQLEDIQSAPSAMSGRVEIVRFRLWGSNLGYGLTGVFGDSPRADGMGFVMGAAHFGYPAVTAYDRASAFLSPGPATTDTCVVRGPTPDAGPVEYVDVGDRVRFSSPVATHISLERDPPAHPRPSGESWYVGYGYQLLPDVQGHPDLPDTWTPGATWSVSFPGTVVPAESTVGAVPYPLANATIQIPEPITGVAVNGAAVRPPNHGYSRLGEWTGEDDDVRFTGPFAEPMSVTWTPSVSQGSVTLVVRLLGAQSEGDCDCLADCDEGFFCESGQCVGADGSSANVLAELACDAEDDGEFVIAPEELAGVWTMVDWTDIRGATLSVARMNEAQATIQDVLTWNGKRVSAEPVRVRAMDVLVTRLERP